MLAEESRRRSRCSTALAVLLVLGTACASRTRTVGETPATQPPAAAAQPSDPAATAPSPATPPTQPPTVAARPAPPAAQPATPAPPAPPSPAATAGLPADHLKDKDGVMHKRGYKQPLGDCTNCHGKDLRGEGEAPSCYKCHGKEWR